MNLQLLTTWASRLAADPQQTRYAGRYTDAANESQYQFAMDSRALFKDFTFSVVANQSQYALPADFMYPKKATLSTLSNTTGGIILTPISRSQLEFSTVDHDWTQDTGTPKFYIIDPASASGFPNSIALYPQPQGADAGTNNAILTYYPLPATLVNPTDIPLNGTTNLVQFHMGLAAYMAWLLVSGEISTPETEERLKRLYGQYQSKVTEAIDKYGNTSNAPWRLAGGKYWHLVMLGIGISRMFA